MARIKKKAFVEQDVHAAAIGRVRVLYDRFDLVAVSFSGGKDSTAALQVCLQVAHERGRLPLDVYFWDEEAIHPETIEYVERVAQRDDVRFKWLCLPVKHRNACSRRQPYWHCWDPSEEAKWVRPMPARAIRELKGFEFGMTIPEAAHLVYGPEHGMVADVRGLRADESLRRYRAVSMRLIDNWIAAPRAGYSYPVSPIYDWTSVDVWTAPRLLGWDYNRAYDVMELAGVGINQQRVCPPYGEEPLTGLWIYAQCWPQLWHKMIARVHGAATAGRYSRTELYGFGAPTKPAGMTWRDWAYAQLDLYPETYRPVIADSVRALIEQHQLKTKRPIPEAEPDLVTGLSWRFIAMIVARGDLKQRRANQVTAAASMARAKHGLEMEDIVEQDEGTRY